VQQHSRELMPEMALDVAIKKWSAHTYANIILLLL
jgi:hypothetical protein